MPINSFENYPMSWKPVIDRSKPHLPQQLAEQMKQDIQDGKLLPGTKLPPQRELADYLDVNLSTITRAYRICLQPERRMRSPRFCPAYSATAIVSGSIH